jgi:hypothetical protein
MWYGLGCIFVVGDNTNNGEGKTPTTVKLHEQDCNGKKLVGLFVFG